VNDSPRVPDKQIKRIALIAAPWTLFDRPSIQIGVLKAHLERELHDIRVDAQHIFLDIAEQIGFPTYQALSQRTWLAETVYAALLYPERTAHIEKMYLQYASKNPYLKDKHFGEITGLIKAISARVLSQTNWEKIDLVGFSVSQCQLTASLYFIDKIKKLNPNLKIVAGGSTFCGPSSKAYLTYFPSIDFIINGEGEQPLTELIHTLNNSGNQVRLSEIGGVVSAHSPINKKDHLHQLANLKKLPVPDFEDYFQKLNQFRPEKRFFPTIPVEASRGCWWKRSETVKSGAGCAFCNLNLQWSGYRKKSANQVVQEIDALTERHQTLSISFMDNVIPASCIKGLSSEMGGQKKDIKLFGEIRSNISLNSLEKMKCAGLGEVQVGIESLSSGLLNRMNKGTRVIQNLEIMKNCETLGLKNVSNLIMRFPGSTSDEVDETLKALDFAICFQPLKTVRFWLGLGSPIWQHFINFGIQSVRNHPGYKVLFPEKIEKNIEFIIQDYRGDLTHQKKLWRPVERKIAEWQKRYAKMHATPFSSPILSFGDGGTFLIIKQRRYDEPSGTHRLTGLSREIYLFCQKNRSIKRMLTFFPGLSEDQLLSFLRMMTDKKLMFREKDRFLSLASPLNFHALR